jgi:hypothetical protein
MALELTLSLFVLITHYYCRVSSQVSLYISGLVKWASVHCPPPPSYSVPRSAIISFSSLPGEAGQYLIFDLFISLFSHFFASYFLSTFLSLLFSSFYSFPFIRSLFIYLFAFCHLYSYLSLYPVSSFLVFSESCTIGTLCSAKCACVRLMLHYSLYLRGYERTHVYSIMVGTFNLLNFVCWQNEQMVDLVARVHRPDVDTVLQLSECHAVL